MKLDQTIKKLKELRLHCQEYAADRERDGEFDTVWHEDVEALDNAIEIIEKEIPKKIYIYDYGKAHCPVCNTDVHGIGKIDFCFSCGQKLDWEV